eukprot:5172288-Prymnesium_polylepis.1
MAGLLWAPRAAIQAAGPRRRVPPELSHVAARSPVLPPATQVPAARHPRACRSEPRECLSHRCTAVHRGPRAPSLWLHFLRCHQAGGRSGPLSSACGRALQGAAVG